LLHDELSANRMCGEWYDISVEHALSIIHRFDMSLKKINEVFQEWVANPENNLEELLRLLKLANAPIKDEGVSEVQKKKTMYFNLVNKYFADGKTFVTTSHVLDIIQQVEPGQYSINAVGAALRKSFKRISKNGLYGYYLDKN
jgi:hypothetical protein